MQKDTPTHCNEEGGSVKKRLTIRDQEALARIRDGIKFRAHTFDNYIETDKEAIARELKEMEDE